MCYLRATNRVVKQWFLVVAGDAEWVELLSLAAFAFTLDVYAKWKGE